ncbi:TIGR04086 family membrane protein [Paradesulfitobacterium ferrireducens]|uniref:TIGR04086 family membrane protein n=1 Tax=Paradesulfitobacterium ferrireducens TaxID=2816476 RepID=UPI001A8CAE9A|nr:TIGR04086 family membrane protein [Paradesulfitobacterium ferrireducens]
MSKSFNLSLVIKGIVIAAVLAFIFSAGFGILLALTSLPESDMASTVIFSASIFIAAILTSYQAGTKGLYYGLAIGFGFVIVLLLVSFILTENTLWLRVGEKSVFAFLAGGIGGIIGVVFKR